MPQTIKPLVAGNWKMNGSTAMLREPRLLAGMMRDVKTKCDILVCNKTEPTVYCGIIPRSASVLLYEYRVARSAPRIGPAGVARKNDAGRLPSRTVLNSTVTHAISPACEPESAKERWRRRTMVHCDCIR